MHISIHEEAFYMILNSYNPFNVRTSEVCRIWWKLTSPSKVMRFPGNQIYGCAAACIKVRCIFVLICVDGNKHSLLICLSFKDTLSVGQYNGTEIAILQSIA